MPIWIVYHPPTTFTTQASKQALSESITEIYTTPTARLPAFYVVVNFIAVDQNNTFIGGRRTTTTDDTTTTTTTPFIRITIDNIAIRMANDDGVYARATAKIDAALKPHIADKGYDWEYHVTETERRLWKINGLAPPAWGSEGEDLWWQENRAVALDEHRVG